MLEYDKLRSELQSYRIELDEDPSAISLNLLHKKVKQSRGFLDRVRSMLLDARKNVRDMEEHLVNITMIYKKEFNTELSKDNIKILKTIAQQTAAVELLLQGRIIEKSKAELEYNRAVDYFNDVKDTYADLRNAGKAVRDQIHIIDQQITIGEIQYKNPNIASSSDRKKVRLDLSSTSPEAIGKSIASTLANQDFEEGEDL